MMPLLMSTRLSRIEAVHTGHCHLGGKKSQYCQLYCKSLHLDKKKSTNEKNPVMKQNANLLSEISKQNKESSFSNQASCKPFTKN
jgi:hypothetical protein